MTQSCTSRKPFVFFINGALSGTAAGLALGVVAYHLSRLWRRR